MSQIAWVWWAHSHYRYVTQAISLVGWLQHANCFFFLSFLHGLSIGFAVLSISSVKYRTLPVAWTCVYWPSCTDTISCASRMHFDLVSSSHAWSDCITSVYDGFCALTTVRFCWALLLMQLSLLHSTYMSRLDAEKRAATCSAPKQKLQQAQCMQASVATCSGSHAGAWLSCHMIWLLSTQAVTAVNQHALHCNY